MTSTDDDLVLPPAGWTPTDADLALLNDEPEVSMDADLGGQAEELKGQEWMNLQRKQAALEEVRQGIDRALRTQEEMN